MHRKYLCLLLTLFVVSVHCEDDFENTHARAHDSASKVGDHAAGVSPNQARHGKPVQYHTATFIVNYEDAMICPGCNLNFATSLNWTDYYPELGYTDQFMVTWVAPNTYRASITYPSTEAGNTHIATVYYSAWNANATGKAWLNANCRTILNNLSGNNKGRQITFTLPSPAADVTYDFYPYFCRDQGQILTFNFVAEQLGGIEKYVKVLVPPGLVENPAPRPVQVLLQGDGFAIEASLKTTYDFAISHGITPELLVFGPGQGTESDPWSDGGAERTYETTPFPCTPFAGGPPCAARCGGGFDYLDFLINTALPAIQRNLSLPAVGRDYMAISGYSNGGLDSCVFAYMNSSIFSRGYCGSGAFWYNNNQFASIVKRGPPSHDIKLYFSLGGREHPFITNFVPAAYAAVLARNGFTLGDNLMFAHYSASPLSHQFNSWAAETPLALAFLYNDGVKLGTCPQGTVYSYAESGASFAMGATFVVPNSRGNQQAGGALENY